MTAEITVTRPDAWKDRWRAYKLIVDGSTVASLGRGETRTVSVSPGVHRVWMKVDWCRSRKIGLELAPGETARLVCRPAFVLSLAPLYVTIWRARYIELERS